MGNYDSGNPYWPLSWGTGTVHGKFLDGAGQPIVGTVTFKLDVSPVHVISGETLVYMKPIVVSLTAGEFTIALPATNDPDAAPNNFTYQVTESWSGRKYHISVPLNSTLELAEVYPEDASTGNPANSAVLAANAQRLFVVSLRDYGAIGDGVTDDTVAIQSAFNAVAPGGMIIADRTKTYVINQTINLGATDRITFDGCGATFVFGTARTGPAKTEDKMFAATNRTGITFRNINIGTALGSVADVPTVGGRIIFATCTDSLIENCRVEAENKSGIISYANTHVTIRNCYVNQGVIGGPSNAYCMFNNNRIFNSPGDAMGGTGYSGAPQKYNTYRDNIISGCNRIGIEEYANGGDPTLCYGAVVDGNRIFNFGTSGSSIMGISIPGSRSSVINNIIEDLPTVAAAYAGIEVSGCDNIVRGNIVRRATPNNSCAGIIVDSSPAGTPQGVVIDGNTVTGFSHGIQCVANSSGAPLTCVTISNNKIIDVLFSGISATQNYYDGAMSITGNVIRFNNQAPASSFRYGIQAAGTTGKAFAITGNTVYMATASYLSTSFDIAFILAQNNISMVSNIVNKGGRSDGNCLGVSCYTGTPNGTYTNLAFMANQWGGTTVNKLPFTTIVNTDGT